MLLNEPDAPLDDVVVVDKLHIADYNEANILPQDKTTLERLLKWLNPTKYAGDGSELKKHATSHLEGTSQWLIGSSIFEQWHHGNSHGILWIRGVPGTGKSVLAAKLIDHLTSEECPVLYFFSRYTIQSNHRPEAALRDWIAQILLFSPPLQLALKNLISGDINIGSVDDLSMAELWLLLRLALKSIPKVYCVVDALDEMDHQFMEEFLQVLDQLGNIHPDRVKLIITSRPIAIIEKIVRNLRLLDIRLGKDKVEPDIVKYTHHRLDKTAMPLEIRDNVLQELLKKADGLFLYAKFAMDAISGLETTTVETVTKVLDGTPVDLSLMYRNLLLEHMGRTDLPEGLCTLVLQLVTHATRPLRLLEIADCIKVTRPRMGRDTAILKSLIRTSCGPLLEILPDETVRVVHHSLTEYLFGLNRSSSNKDILLFKPGPTHNLVALVCLSYLRAGCLDTMYVEDPKHYYMRLIGKEHQLPPFMMYAADNWHVHYKTSSSQGFPQDEIHQIILSLLMTPDHPNRLCALANRLNRRDEDLEGVPRDSYTTREAEALLFAIYLDLTSFVEYFLKHGNSDAATYPGARHVEPPLHKAIKNGNIDIVRLLIEKGAKASHRSTRGHTPLHLALGGNYRIRRPYPAIVEHLLQVGADPWKDRGKNKEISDVSGRPHVPCPPIREALSMGDESIVKLFLPFINSGEMAQRALDWAMNSSQKAEIIHLILSLGLADVNARTKCKTPLFRACSQLDPRVISVLLEAGADPNALHDNEDDVRRGRGRRSSPIVGEGRNVLHVMATELRYRGNSREETSDKRIAECFELVIKAGADVNQIDRSKSTPLHLVTVPLVAELLLEAGANPIAMDIDGSTPLHLASSVDLMEVLLTKTDINIRNFKGKPVLLSSFFDIGHRKETHGKSAPEKTLRLLDLGADPNITDNDGDSILHYLCVRGKMNKPDGRLLLERLIQSGADANLRNNKGQTAIHKFTFSRWLTDTEMDDLEALLELTHIDINTVDDDGDTFLFRNIGSLAGSIAEIVDRFMTAMVKAGARFDVTDKQGRTLLHDVIRRSGDEKIFKLLVEYGVDPEQTDNEGNTIWHAAAPRFVRSMGSKNLLENIKALGVDVRKPNNRGRLPLHLLCENCRYFEEKLSKVSKKRPDLFNYILEQGHEDMNRADNDGVLPLHLASTFSTRFTRMILGAGADATPTTHEGLNVFHLAARWRQSNTIGLLVDWFMVNVSTERLFEAVNAKDKRGRNPLFYACLSGHYQSVELLIKAGVVVDLVTYEGSALQGCVEFEEELKHPVDRRASTFDAVHFIDTAQPENGRRGRLLQSRATSGQHRINEILDLLKDNTTSESWREIDRAIVEAASRQHDYTMESLLRVRNSLGMEDALLCTSEVQACLERRASVLANVANVTTGPRAFWTGDLFTKQIHYMVQQRLYHAIPSYIKEYSPKPEIKELYAVLLELVRSGHASLLDALLTPELISDLEKSSHSTEGVTMAKSGMDMVSLLIAACESEEPNLPVIHVLVKKGAKVDECSIANKTAPPYVEKPTPLHALVKVVNDHWWQTAQALPYMLNQAPNLEVRDEKGLTPLNAYLEEKDQPGWKFEVTEILLRAGADPSSVDNGGTSCLARTAGHEALFKLLLRYGAVASPAALAAAILAKDLNMLEMMLTSGADPNVRKVYNETSHGPRIHPYDEQTELYALDLVITGVGYKDHNANGRDMMELLFKHGADPNKSYTKTTIAHRILRWHGSNARSNSGTRDYYVNAIMQHPLLDVNLKDAAGVTLLQAAYEEGDLKSAWSLLERGCNIYEQDNDGRNILHLPPRRVSKVEELQAQQDFLENLLTLSPELLHQVDNHGRTPLHCSMFGWRAEETFKLFLSNGADVSAKDVDGNTPLHLLFRQKWFLAVDDGNMVLDESTKRIADVILSSGADINARNEAGETPVFSYFREGGLRATVPHDEERRKASEDSRIYDRWHMKLERTTAVEQEQLIWAIFDQFGVDWIAVNNEGQSLLHVVAAEGTGKKQRFQFLMGKGLDALTENNIHQTALDVAAANGSKGILSLFNVG